MEQNTAALVRKKLFVLDLDGTFYLEDSILPGSASFLEACRQTGKDVLFLTNNSSHTADFYRRRLKGMGCDTALYKVVTSGDVAVSFLRRERPGARVFLLGDSALRACFAQEGIPLGAEHADIVVAAFDAELTYRDVFLACRLIRGGAEFFATNPDLNCPVQGGLAPDCGSICAMLSAATGVRPVFLGKPCGPALRAVTELTGAAPGEIVFVGDRLNTDVAMGVSRGITGVLVLCGATTAKEAAGSPIRPDFVFPTLGELGDVLRGCGSP